jgi:hypothetical protein
MSVESINYPLVNEYNCDIESLVLLENVHVNINNFSNIKLFENKNTSNVISSISNYIYRFRNIISYITFSYI